MEKTIEKLPQDLVDKLLNYQKDANLYLLELGQIEIQERELNSQLKKLQDFKTATFENFDKVSLNLENIVNDLQKNYPNGEIDLNEGTIIYEK